MNETQFQVRWRKYARHTGIKCTPHQLRHEFTSVLVGSGLTPEEVQILVGHANISTTMDIYKHLKQERAQKIAEKARSIF
jgi:site-specific recombinase XerD